MKIGHLVTAPLASFMAVLTIVATQGMSGRESSAFLLLGYAGGWFLLFGLGAVLPMLFDRTARESAFAAFLAFGVGGGIAGGLIAILFVTHNLGGSPAAVKLAFAIPLSLPWLLGAAFWFFVRASGTGRA